MYTHLEEDECTNGSVGVIFSTFQGELRVETQQVLVRSNLRENDKPRFDIDRGDDLHVGVDARTVTDDCDLNTRDQNVNVPLFVPGG